MTAPMLATVRPPALGRILLCALLVVMAGCTKPAPPPELEREMAVQFATLPALPDSKEIGRKFLYKNGEFLLEVTYDAPTYRYSYDWGRSWGNDVWKYKATISEAHFHLYVKDGWQVTLRNGYKPGKVILLLYRNHDS
ncbi:MAG TPA: hypothetical protein VK464_07755 [Symbiobacteriaceae bacterium]|jgi:hypothetical protein|nr:hypothetical protein [Symbiobacteriaceae bacterium]